MAHSPWPPLAWTVVAVLSVAIGLELSVVLPCAWVTGGSLGDDGDALDGLSRCGQRLLPYLQESFSAIALDQPVEHGAVRVNDSMSMRSGTRWQKFITSDNDTHARSAHDKMQTGQVGE